MIPAVTMLPRSASRQSHRRPGDGRITSHSRVRSHVARGGGVNPSSSSTASAIVTSLVIADSQSWRLASIKPAR